MIIGTVNWSYPSYENGYKYELHFFNHITGAEEHRTYATHKGAACAETRFHNRMSRLYGHLDTTDYQSRSDDAHRIARVLDRLANLLDPYEYYDVVGRTPVDWDRNVETIASDLIRGNTQPYIEWLRSVDHDLDERDHDRVRLAKDSIERFERRYTA